MWAGGRGRRKWMTWLFLKLQIQDFIFLSEKKFYIYNKLEKMLQIQKLVCEYICLCECTEWEWRPIEFENFRFRYNIFWLKKLVLFLKIKNNFISEHVALEKQITYQMILVSKLQLDL